MLVLTNGMLFYCLSYTKVTLVLTDTSQIKLFLTFSATKSMPFFLLYPSIGMGDGFVWSQSAHVKSPVPDADLFT